LLCPNIGDHILIHLLGENESIEISVSICFLYDSLCVSTVSSEQPLTAKGRVS